MRNPIRKSFLLLFISPFLMGTTALPPPGVVEEQYSGFTLDYIKEDTVGDDYEYSFRLNNFGEGYIEHMNIVLSNEETYFSSFITSADICSPFLNGVYQPGFNDTVVFTSSTRMPDNINDLHYYGYGYSTMAEEARVSGSKEVTFVSANSYEDRFTTYGYRIDLFLSNRNEDHFYYGAILEVEYKDEICYIKVDQPDDYYFETSQQLDLSQLTVNKVIPIKSHYGPSYNFWEYLDWFSIFEIFMVISIPISFIIFAATFFPALARRKRRERNKTAD